MNQEFWLNKKVLITGHTGFKGSWLTACLKSKGANITGFALPASEPSLFTLANLDEGITSVYGNILDIKHLFNTIQTKKPEIIFHLAAQSLVNYSYQNPVETFSVNVMGTVNLLDIIRNVSGVKSIVVVTSDKCYENKEWVWGYRESDAMGGYDPYSSSKGCAELVTSAYRSSFFNPAHYDKHGVALATARAGNVIGGGDWAEARLIPDLVRAFIKKEIGMIRNPHAFRPWQYILDVLQGYMILAEALWQKGYGFAEAWNFGPNEENLKSVAWVADKVTSLWGENAEWSVTGKNELHEANNLKLDCNKSRLRLGWEPKMTINAMLKHTLEWYQHHYKNKNMKEFTEKQISDYEIIMRNN